MDFATWFTLREISPEQLRDLFVQLQVELEKVESFFQLTSVVRPCAHMPDSGAPTVWLAISDLGSRELVALALLHLGYKLAPPNSPARPGVRVAGMVIGEPLPATEQEALQKSGISIVDFAAWRALRPEAAKWVSAPELLRWLSSQLGPSR